MNQPIARGQKSATILEALRQKEESVEELVKAMRTDPYVMLAERTVRANVAAAQISVVTESNDKRARALAATLDEVWRNHISQMLECFAFGRAAFEVVYHSVGGWLHTVQRLEPLPYEHTEPLFHDGRARGVVLGGAEEPLPLPEPYGWWLALDATALNPHGVSRYKGAMEAVWQERRELTDRRRTFIKKYVLGTAVARLPQTRLGPSGETIDAWDEFADAWRAADGGDCLTLSNEKETDAAGQSHYKYDIQTESLGAKDGQPIITMGEALGKEILQAVGIPPQTVTEGDTGSFALVTQQMVVLMSMIEEVLSQIVQQFQGSIVDQACKLNGTSGVEVNFVPLTTRPDDLAVELVKLWGPALLTTPGIDVRAVLEAAGVPTESAEKAAAVFQPGQQPVAQMAAPLSFRMWR